MNIKLLKNNDELNFLVIVLNSLQNLQKKNLYMLIEAKKSLKRRCEKNTKIKTLSK